MTPALRELPALAGVLRRNFDYDRFWVAFPLVNEQGGSLVPASASTATLKVRIYDQEGRVSWPVSPSTQARVRQLEQGGAGEKR